MAAEPSADPGEGIADVTWLLFALVALEIWTGTDRGSSSVRALE